jgi:hypothetical protein
VKWSSKLGAYRSDLLALAGLALGALTIGMLREPLAKSFHRVHSSSDAYLLPDPNTALVVSLGYRSALADFIFGHVLVSQGLHFAEHRLFTFVGEYLETISALDPKFRQPYRYADTLLTLQAKPPPPEFYRKARRIQELGLKELPYDQELWSTAGQFMAYLAPAQLKDPAEKLEYERIGARYLMRACELIGSNDRIPHHCITAANLLNEDGKREASRQMLERLLTVSDDPELQALASNYLARLGGEQREQQQSQRRARFQSAWRDSLPFVARVEINALMPSLTVAACAGSAAFDKPACASSWARWASLDAEAHAAP